MDSHDKGGRNNARAHLITVCAQTRNQIYVYSQKTHVEQSCRRDWRAARTALRALACSSPQICAWLASRPAGQRSASQLTMERVNHCAARALHFDELAQLTARWQAHIGKVSARACVSFRFERSRATRRRYDLRRAGRRPACVVYLRGRIRCAATIGRSR